MAPTRWGIVSTGLIAFDFTNALGLLPAEDHQVLAVAARDLPRAEAFAKEFSIPNAYGSYKELADNPNIDVVYIATMHPFHFELCKLMIEAGKNVLCEKPLTMNLKQAKTIISLAKEKNVFLMEGYWSRFFPVCEDVRRALARGDIGEVKFVQVDFGKTVKTTPGDGYLGIMPALGGYPVQLALMAYPGEVPEKVTATGHLEEGADRSVFVTLHFSNERVAQLAIHSRVTLSKTARIYGTKGSIEVPFFWCPNKAVVGEKTYEYPLPQATRPMNYVRSDGFIYEAEAVRQSLLKGEKENPLLPLEETLRIISITDEIRRQIGVVYDADNQ